MSNLKAFQIKAGSKILDYQLGKKLNLDDIKYHFEKKYSVKKLYSGGRHILGILEKNHRILFLKLSTTEGISELTKNEYRWNKEFNKLVLRKSSKFWVPENEDSGFYQNNLFYLITDYFAGQLLALIPEKSKPSPILLKSIPSIIELSELIQRLNLASLSVEENSRFRSSFLVKTNSWYEAIPEKTKKEYKLNNLLNFVKDSANSLQGKPRHGDFTPWHLIKLETGQLGLIDGEHAKKNGVEYYDIGYFIQRVFSVLKNPILAENILSHLSRRNYNLEKLRIILAARAIGGFLDESLKPFPDYKFSNNFKDWIIKISLNKSF